MNTPGSYRKTLSQLALAGSLDRHPSRYASRSNCPEPAGPLGDPPASLTEIEKAIWDEFITKIPATLAGSSDTYIVQIAVQLLGKMNAHTIRTGEYQVLLTCLQKLAMSPIDRQRIARPPAVKNDDVDWAAILTPTHAQT